MNWLMSILDKWWVQLIGGILMGLIFIGLIAWFILFAAEHGWMGF